MREPRAILGISAASSGRASARGQARRAGNRSLDVHGFAGDRCRAPRDASACVVKTAHPEDLASAVRQAFSHSVYLAGRRTVASATAAEAEKWTTLLA